MPQYTSLVTNSEISTEDFLAISYGTLEHLGWKISYATDTTLIGFTPRKWNKWDHQVTIDVTDGEKTVTSTSIHGEAMDIPKRNKKHCDEFITAYNNISGATTPETLLKWKALLGKVKEGTVVAVEKEMNEIEEIDKVMNFSTGKPHLTYGLIAINLLIFIIMAISGVNVLSPLVSDIEQWGGNIADKTFSGEAWRLFTSMFIHIGVLHVLLNMYALYMVGSQLEPMLGKLRFGTAYLCAGLLASLVSVYWNRNDNIVSAGASGAIFGMFGVFIALLTTNIIPKRVRNEQMGSMLFFVAYNIFYGFRQNSGIDNAAHIGGLVAGMAIGYVYAVTFKKNNSFKNLGMITIAAATTLVVSSVVANTEYSRPAHMLAADQDRIQSQLLINEFSEFETKASTAESELKNETDPAVMLAKMESIIFPSWKNADQAADRLLEIGDNRSNEKLTILKTFSELKVEWSSLVIRSMKEDTHDYSDRINELVTKINAIIEEAGSDSDQ